MFLINLNTSFHECFQTDQRYNYSSNPIAHFTSQVVKCRILYLIAQAKHENVKQNETLNLNLSDDESSESQQLRVVIELLKEKQ